MGGRHRAGRQDTHTETQVTDCAERRRGRPPTLGARLPASLALKLQEVEPERLARDRDAADLALRTLEKSRERRASGDETSLPRQDTESVMRSMRAQRNGRAAPLEVSPGLILKALTLLGRSALERPGRRESNIRLSYEKFRAHEARHPKATGAQRIKEVAADMGLTEETIRRYLRAMAARG